MCYCCVRWCGKNSTTSNYKKDGITFHRFPKSQEMKAKWIAATHRPDSWKPSRTSNICSRHFTDDCFHQITLQRRRLLKSAVPTLYLPILGPATSDTGNNHTNEQNTNPTVRESVYIQCDENTDIKQEDDSVSHESMEEETLQPQNTIEPTVEKTSYEICYPESPSAYDTPVEKRLCRRVMELNFRIKEKNVKLKRLRESNRNLKLRIIALKSRLEEMEKRFDHGR